MSSLPHRSPLPAAAFAALTAWAALLPAWLLSGCSRDGVAIAEEGESPAVMPAGGPRVKFETSVGDFTVELDPVNAPISTENFLAYVKSGYYEGTIFHRVIPGFVVQAGGFDSSLEPKEPGREPIANESRNGLSNDRGTLAMARTQDPNSARAQFYVNLTDNVRLNGSADSWGYAVFGRVVNGMETLDAIAEVPTGPRPPLPRDVPQSNIIIEKTTLLPADG